MTPRLLGLLAGLLLVFLAGCGRREVAVTPSTALSPQLSPQRGRPAPPPPPPPAPVPRKTE